MGVGEWTVRFAIVAGAPDSKFGMTAGVRFIDGSESQTSDEAEVGCPRSIIGESGSAGERKDLPAAAADWDRSTVATVLSSMLTLPLPLRPESPLSFLPCVLAAFEVNEVVDVFHVTFEGVPGREETAIGW